MTKLLVIAGEVSGDIHGGNVIQELRAFRPDLDIFGVGGEYLRSAGGRLFYRVEDLAVLGFVEVAKRYRSIKAIFDRMVRELDRELPDAVLLVDYPGFNLRFAEEAKKRGIPVFYYISPQVWAWKKGRVEKIKRVVDHLIVLFPFEVEFYAREGMEAHCFGHPLLDIVYPTADREETCFRWGLDPEKRLISLLPGSRENEIRNHLPLLYETAKILSDRRNDLQFVFPLALTVRKEAFSPFVNRGEIEARVVEGDTYNAVASSDFALVASGTATLETAILGTPLILFYKSTLSTYLIAKYLFKIQQIGLPNIVAGRSVVPEVLYGSSPTKMAEKVLFFLENEGRYNTMRRDLIGVKDKLGEKGAYQKTARFIDSVLVK